MATPHIVPRENGEGGIGTAAKGWGEAFVTDVTASSATQGGKLILAANDGAAMADNHRLGVIEFKGAEDGSGTLTVGARIEAICDATWSASENGASLEFYTTDANAAESLALTINSDSEVITKGPIIFRAPAVTNLADNGTIPIHLAFADIDANGGARTGIRFAEAGTAGQVLTVRNSGGEALTFHNTEGTALLRGIHADHDTMEANTMALFISDGTFWNLIAGGRDSRPDVGFTAS